ncbi:MAG TPA: DUF1559 domain-containing protein [Pirellulales bacterium]|nr:DUF1559 domain-containing protein [Pirellulales bacterium]
MPCPRCGAESGDWLAVSAERATCRRCGASIILSEPQAALTASVLPQRRNSPILLLLLLGFLALVTGFGLGARIFLRGWMARRQRASCEAQLHKISVALKNYADENSVYPPAVVRDAQGRPLHSWRVLILPQLGKDEEELHKEYHYDEPWDGPHNRELTHRMPAVYRCPEDPGALDSQTSYLAIVDGSTDDFAAYPTNGSNAPPKNPPLTAYLVVEVADSGINWLEPKDVSLDKNGKPEQPLPAQFGYHVGGSVAVDADGSTIVLADDEMARAIVAKPSTAVPNP